MADLPSLGRQVHLTLSVRRFYCRNAACPRRTFIEACPALLTPRSRRTRRLATAQAQAGVTCGRKAGARLLQGLAMPASADAVLRLVRALPLAEAAPPRVVGVDAWALKKGQVYGTLLVDLETRRVADLLPDRTAPTLAKRLQDHRSVEVIALDRSRGYARGAALGAPQAVQAADRWHLLYNCARCSRAGLAGIQGRLQRLPRMPTPAGPGRRAQVYPRTRTEAAAALASRA